MPIPTLPSLRIASALPRQVDVLVAALTESGLRPIPGGIEETFRARFGVSIAEMARSLGAKGKAGQTRTLPAGADGTRIVVVGLDSDEPTPEELRQAAGEGVRHSGSLGQDQPVTVAVAFDVSEPEQVQAVAEGALLGSYRYTPISSVTPTPLPVSSVTVVGPGSKAETTSATVAAQAVAVAREWVNIPANLLYPASFAEEAQRLLKSTKVAVDVLDEAALERDGYGGLLAVGGGSARPPRLVRLSYRPRGASFHLVLVGKGITFDTGGLNLKPGDSMYTMKCDMAGAAAVIAATWAIAQLGLKISVTTYGALAENMPSDQAYRPSDVITMYGGKTVENGNSDAEGRIVMADALARSAADGPDLIVDVATLTGACVVALGEKTSGVMATDNETADQILDAAEVAGEPFWQLPIPKETRGKLDSRVADLKSTGDRWGGALTAAAFLREFVADGTPWAHLDIAGPAFSEGGGWGYTSPGGTGVGVRTLIALARTLAS